MRDDRRRRRLRHARRPRRRRTGRDDRRRLAADLPDLDLRPGWRRAARAAATSTRARRTPPASGSSGRSRRSRAGRTGSPSRRARPRPRRSPSSPDRATRSSSAMTSTAGRSATSSGSAGGAGVDSLRRPRGGPDVLWEALTERTRLVWFETPSNPLLKVVDIAARSRDRRAASGGGRPAAAHRGRQHVRVAGPPAAAPARRGHRLPLGDEVPGRPFGHDRRRGGHVGRRGRRAAALPAERDGRRARAARLLPRPARAAHAPSRMERHAANAVAVARSSRTGRTSRTCTTRASAGWSRSSRPGGGRTAGPPRSGRSRSPRRPGLFTLAESLGGVESLIEVPAAMTHMSVAGSPLEVDPALVRLSVGIEDVGDLIADLARLDGAWREPARSRATPRPASSTCGVGWWSDVGAGAPAVRVRRRARPTSRPSNGRGACVDGSGGGTAAQSRPVTATARFRALAVTDRLALASGRSPVGGAFRPSAWPRRHRGRPAAHDPGPARPVRARSAAGHRRQQDSVSPSPTGVSSASRWRTSVSLRNAFTNRLRSPSGPSSWASRPGGATTRPVTTSRTVPPGTSTCFAPPVAVRSVGGMRTVLMRAPEPALERRQARADGRGEPGSPGPRDPVTESEQPASGVLSPFRSAARRPRRRAGSRRDGAPRRPRPASRRRPSRGRSPRAGQRRGWPRR